MMAHRPTGAPRKMATHRAIALAALLGALMLTSCKKTPPPDGVCTYEPTPAGGDIPAGQGGVQILGATDTYFYVFDNTGTQIASGGVNRLVALKPGEYQVKINNSAHTVSVQSKTMAKCATGTALGKGATEEYYYIFNETG